jgi:hypothetical protein
LGIHWGNPLWVLFGINVLFNKVGGIFLLFGEYIRRFGVKQRLGKKVGGSFYCHSLAIPAWLAFF